MANIKFYPYKAKGECKIYFRLKIGAQKDFRLSTGLTIKDAKDWSEKTNYPKTNNTENKNLKSSLENLYKVIDKYILSVEKDETLSIRDIHSKDIKSIVIKFNNLEPVTEKDLLSGYSEYFVNELPQSTYTKNGIQYRYSQKTIDKYSNFSKVLKGYNDHLGRETKIVDVDEEFGYDFLTYLTDLGRSINTKGRYIKRLITILKHAEKNGIKVNPGFRNLKGFEDETIVTYLNFDEINDIIEKDMPNNRLEIAKDWFIIALFTAQRISDLHRFNRNNIQTIQGGRFICCKQFKTGKYLEVPIHYRVEEVLKKYNGNFPPKFTENEQSQRSILSSLIKEVCSISGINEKVQGRYNGKKGIYPKYKLISNHTGRKSFACNFYNLTNWSVQEIMNITGHENPKNFYKYIDRTDRTLSINARNKFDEMEIEDKKLNIEKEKEPQLNIVKNASNN